MAMVGAFVFIGEDGADAAEVASSGECGDGLEWIVDSGVLRIVYDSSSGGSGEMDNYSAMNAPWYRLSFGKIIVGPGVKSIGDNAFYFLTDMHTVEISDSVTSIGNFAFYGCSNAPLKHIDIPDSVKSIGNYAFACCTALTSFTIPDSVKSIGEGAFSMCSSMKSVKISNNLAEISERAFAYCDALASVTIPNSVTTIGYYAFFDCDALASVTIPNSVTSIDAGAFSACGLTSVTIPNSVKEIRDYTFNLCDLLTSVTIPNSVTSIGKYAFDDCDLLESVTIPDSVKSIGEEAFDACTSLASISIPDSVTSIGENAFRGCKSITEIYFGLNVGYTSKIFPNFRFYWDGSQQEELDWSSCSDFRGKTFTGSSTAGMVWVPVVITFDPDDGSVDPDSMTVGRDGRLTELPTAIRFGYTFEGWSTPDGEIVSLDKVYTEDITLYAHWVEGYLIVFDPSGGKSYPPVMTTDKDGMLSKLPKAIRFGYTFEGWYTSDGEFVTLDKVYTEDTTLYARWSEGYIITFDSDGGRCSPSVMRTGTDGKLHELPKATWAEHIFEGWYTASGTIVSLDTVYTGATTLYAQWLADDDDGSSVIPSDDHASGGSRKGSSDSSNVFIVACIAAFMAILTVFVYSNKR